MKDKISTILKEAEALRGECRFNESLKLFKKALSLSKENSNLDEVIDSELAIADIYRIKGDFDKALFEYSEVIEICDAIGFERTKADAMVGMALSMKAKGFWKEALKNIKKANSFYIKEKDRKGLAFSFWAEGSILRVKGDIKGAITKFNEARDIFDEQGFKSGIGYALCGLGGAHRMAGDNDKSMFYYKEANNIFTLLNDKFGTAYSYCGIGNAYRMENDYKTAMDFFIKATKLYEEFGDIVSHSYTLWSMANVCKMREDLKGAENYLNKAIVNFKKTKDMRGIAYCYLTNGEIELMRGDYEKAKVLFKKAFQITNSFDFMLERCYANSFLNILIMRKSKEKAEPNLISCYKKIGVHIYPEDIPYNMP